MKSRVQIMSKLSFLSALVWATPGFASDDALTRRQVAFDLGSYQPAISKNQDAVEFFELMYGKYNSPMMGTLSVHEYPWRNHGLVGWGVKVGVWKVDGPARLCKSGTEMVGCSSTTVFDSEPGNTPTRLTVLPLSVEAVYRYDYLRRAHGVALEPYVKAGLDYHLWWANTNGEIAERTVDGQKQRGKGGTAGYHGSVGLMVNLDWLEPRTAARARRNSGIAGTFLFVELNRVFGDGFGDRARLDMSDQQLKIGFAMDFL